MSLTFHTSNNVSLKRAEKKKLLGCHSKEIFLTLKAPIRKRQTNCFSVVDHFVRLVL